MLWGRSWVARRSRPQTTRHCLCWTLRLPERGLALRACWRYLRWSSRMASRHGFLVTLLHSPFQFGTLAKVSLCGPSLECSWEEPTSWEPRTQLISRSLVSEMRGERDPWASIMTGCKQVKCWGGEERSGERRDKQVYSRLRHKTQKPCERDKWAMYQWWKAKYHMDGLSDRLQRSLHLAVDCTISLALRELNPHNNYGYQVKQGGSDGELGSCVRSLAAAGRKIWEYIW
jgi:hypothetical protein